MDHRLADVRYQCWRASFATSHEDRFSRWFAKFAADLVDPSSPTLDQGPGVVPFWCEMPVWDDLCEYEVMRERGVSACRRDEGARLR
jgi:hypothetical protein